MPSATDMRRDNVVGAEKPSLQAKRVQEFGLPKCLVSLARNAVGGPLAYAHFVEADIKV